MGESYREELLWRFHEGTETYGYQFFGAHPTEVDGEPGWVFRVWAPQAQAIAITGDFNGWSDCATWMQKVEDEIWECTVKGLPEFTNYKYVITAKDGKKLWKADPYAFGSSLRPETNSRLCDPTVYQWGDAAWLRNRRLRDIRRRTAGRSRRAP